MKSKKRSSLGDDVDIREPKIDNYICVWHIQDISSPKYILSSKSIINCCSFIDNYVIVAGCNDGSLLCWDLDENTSKLDETFNRNIKLPSQIIMEENSERGSITQIAFMDNTEYDINTQVCVLHKYGYISIWTIVKNQQNSINKINLSKDSGLTLQSNIRLIHSHILKIKPLKSNKFEQLLNPSVEQDFLGDNRKDYNKQNKMYNGIFDKSLNENNMDLLYEKMCLDATDARLVYVFAQHSSHVVACNVSWDDRFQYYSFNNDSPLSICSNSYRQSWLSLLCTENVYIFKKFHPRPIIKISINTTLTNSIKEQTRGFIKCSPSYPGLLFCIKESCLRILDVQKQDVLCEGNFKDKILDVELCRRQDRDYLIISLKGRIEVHKISKKYRVNNPEDINRCEEEIKGFIQLF